MRPPERIGAGVMSDRSAPPAPRMRAQLLEEPVERARRRRVLRWWRRRREQLGALEKPALLDGRSGPDPEQLGPSGRYSRQRLAATGHRLQIARAWSTELPRVTKNTRGGHASTTGTAAPGARRRHLGETELRDERAHLRPSRPPRRRRERAELGIELSTAPDVAAGETECRLTAEPASTGPPTARRSKCACNRPRGALLGAPRSAQRRAESAGEVARPYGDDGLVGLSPDPPRGRHPTRPVTDPDELREKAMRKA